MNRPGLRRYARDPLPASGPPGPADGAGERCDICGTAVDGRHGHLVSLDDRALRCVCPACRLLFTSPAAGGGRLRAVPERYLTDPAHPLDDGDWATLGIPVTPAFLFHNSDLDRTVACYPSPAGVTESLPDPSDVARLRARHPLLRAPAPDVEAVYVCGIDRGHEAFLVPVDACFALAGAIRLRWRGPDGGPGVRQAVAEFAADLRARCRPLPPDGD